MHKRSFILTVPGTVFHVAVAAVLIGVIIGTAVLVRPTEKVTARFPETTVRTSAGGCYGSGSAPWGFPSGCLFGLHDQRALVSSQFAYEAGLVPNVSADDDYILGYGVQEVIRLPGHRWDSYIYRGSAYVPGSGTALLFATSAGDAFALFHISVSYLSAGALPPLRTALAAPVTRQLSGDEATVLAIEAMPRTGAVGATILHGGTKVGLSGWPSSLAYSNGSCYDAVSCESDAHMCLSASAGALAFFWRIENGQDRPPKPKPHPFNAKLWGKRAYRDKHHKLLWQASVWRHHMWLGAYLDHDRWFPPSKKSHRPRGFTKYHFRHGSLYCWPSTHRCKAAR